jgi:hypothetical protein
LPFGLDLGPSLPRSDPWAQAAAPFTSVPPPLPNLPASALANLDPSSPYWLRTIFPPDLNGSGLPLSTPPANAALDASLQQALAAMGDPATLPIPPALPPVFPTAPPNGGWHAGGSSLGDILAGSDAERPVPPAAGDLASVAAPGIPAAPPTSAAPEDSRHFYDATPAASGQPGGAAAATASPTMPLGRSQTWPARPPSYAGDAPWPRAGIGARSDPRILSDVTPDNDWTPGARYASKSNNRPTRPSGPVRLGEGRWVEPEGGQALRLIEAQTRAQNAIVRARELDPNWRPRPSQYESVEGLIRAHVSEAEQAQARLRELARQQFSPLIPAESRRPGQRWSDTAREIAQWLVKDRGYVVEGVSWLFEAEPSIEAYLDPPKALEELQRAVSNPKQGYDIHHIVEKTSAEDDGFPKSMIHGPDNLVRIPRFKHWEITSWYMTKNRAYQNLPPRVYVRDKDWATRRSVGLDGLIEHGVLKP